MKENTAWGGNARCVQQESLDDFMNSALIWAVDFID